MLSSRNIHRLLLLALAALAVIAVSGCSSDNPTAIAPDNTGQTPGGGPGGSSYNLTVTANPSEVFLGTAGEPTPTSTVTINARRPSDNAAPPTGTTVQVTASLGTVDEATVELTNGQAIVTFTPPTTTGTAVVQATLQGSSASATIVIRSPEDPPPFFLSHAQPSVVDPAGGDRVAIIGGGFLAPANVTIGGANAQVLSVEPTRIRVVVPPTAPLPAGQTRTVAIAVSIGVGTSQSASASLAAALVYAAGGNAVQPRIFSVTPNTGPNEGGTQVTLRGSGFQPPVQVKFHPAGSAASVEAQLVSTSSSEITVLTPEASAYGQALLNGLVDIEVVNLENGFFDLAVNAFRYGVPVVITSLGPAEGPHTGGTLVTLTGQGFDEPVAVSLAGYGQQIISVSGREIVVRTVAIETCSDVTGPSSVTNIDTGDSGTGPDFTYTVPVAVVTNVTNSVTSDNTGDEDGGYPVTVEGQGFDAPVRVKFGGQAANVLTTSPTVVTVTAPPFTGDFGVQACEIGEVAGERFIATAVDVSVQNLVPGCPPAVFEGGFIYVPDDTSCRTTDTTPPDPGTAPVASFTFFQSLGTTTVNFNDTSANGPTLWTWDFDNDGTVDLSGANPAVHASPSHDYGAVGNYVCRLTVSNAAGSASVTMQVSVL